MTDQLAGRRGWMRFAAALLAVAAVPSRAQTAAGIIEQPDRGYRFLPGGAVFAGGAVALPGFAIEHAILKPWLPLDEGYARAEAYLKSIGRPMQALCGMELRLPRQLTMDEFQAFNAPYVERLVRWGLMAEGRNPVSRTNVAPALEPPEVPCLHGFSYTVPADTRGGQFVMSGMTELSPGGVVAAGDDSPAGMRDKVRYVIGVVGRRLEQLGVSFRDASHIEFYAGRAVEGLVADLLVPVLDDAVRRGIRWHYGRPPVRGVEIELEARNVAREVFL